MKQETVINNAADAAYRYLMSRNVKRERLLDEPLVIGRSPELAVLCQRLLLRAAYEKVNVLGRDEAMPFARV